MELKSLKKISQVSEWPNWMFSTPNMGEDCFKWNSENLKKMSTECDEKSYVPTFAKILTEGTH